MILRILLKQNTALLSTVRPSVRTLNQNHPGFLSSKDQTRQDHLLRPDQLDHWFWLWIIKNINAESAVFTLSCYFFWLLSFAFWNSCFASACTIFPTLLWWFSWVARRWGLNQQSLVSGSAPPRLPPRCPLLLLPMSGFSTLLRPLFPTNLGTGRCPRKVC